MTGHRVSNLFNCLTNSYPQIVVRLNNVLIKIILEKFAWNVISNLVFQGPVFACYFNLPTFVRPIINQMY